jgi:hypothetical protein
MKEKLFASIEPFLSYIIEGKLFRQPFGWLYVTLAAIHLQVPLYILIKAIYGRIFDLGAKYGSAFCWIWLLILAAGWAGFQIWWHNRKGKVWLASPEGSEFPTTPVISHFIQTNK